MSSNVMASFSAFGDDLPFIALIVLYSLEGSILWFSVSTNCLHVFLRCSFDQVYSIHINQTVIIGIVK